MPPKNKSSKNKTAKKRPGPISLKKSSPIIDPREPDNRTPIVFADPREPGDRSPIIFNDPRSPEKRTPVGGKSRKSRKSRKTRKTRKSKKRHLRR